MFLEDGVELCGVDRFERQPASGGGAEACTFEIPKSTTVHLGGTAVHSVRHEGANAVPIHITKVTGGIGGVGIVAVVLRRP